MRMSIASNEPLALELAVIYVRPMYITLILAYLLCPVSADDVLAMMSRLPVTETSHTLGHWERIGNATQIAYAIATVAPDRTTAALMVTYSAFEGGNRKCAVGDGGRSLGPYQLQRVSPAIACDPMKAATEWLARATASVEACSDLPEDERLSAYVSGNCEHGHVLARRRATIAKAIVTAY
jgi:hypothetical protein